MNSLTMRSRKKSKDTSKQKKMKTQQPKIYGQSESSPKREIHSFTDLTQKTRKTSITQSKFTLKGNRGKKQQQSPN